ncbi:peptidoglycan-binding protein [Accumulibacter sp.]|uniref:peptidoglycan-binding protein n=1 Tax=Accumulibacter sp. TaxID=2053492 RepID=UPI00391A11E7
MNQEQIRNPNRIFPGDVIILDRDPQGNPMLRLQSSRVLPQIHAELIEQAIPAIPPNVIRPFLSEPLIVEAHGLDHAALIVATPQDRVFIGNGDLAYVSNADPAEPNWQIYRNGKPLRDPETDEILGYEAFYLGTARQLEAGNPATFEVVTVKQEIGRGDRMLPTVRPPIIAYVPHKPDFSVDGRVISVYGGVDAAGRGSILAINRGAKDGIEIAHVLAVDRNRVIDERNDNDQKIAVQIPVLRTGLLVIFRVFDRISYGLVVQAEGTIDVNDFIRTP